MFLYQTFRKVVRIEPKHFGPQLLEVVTQSLMAEYEGKYLVDEGYVVNVVSVTSVGDALVQEGTGLAVFAVSFTAIVLKLFAGEPLDAVVDQANAVAITARVGPITVFIHNSALPRGFSFVQGGSTDPHYEDSTGVSIKPRDRIRLKITSVRYDANTAVVYGKLNDACLGLIGDDF
eukprot:m51a1_g8054 putative dna-directed rna polymerase ii subunit rpb7-like (176) ;mRNA; r:119916-120685